MDTSTPMERLFAGVYDGCLALGERRGLRTHRAFADFLATIDSA